MKYPKNHYILRQTARNHKKSLQITPNHEKPQKKNAQYMLCLNVGGEQRRPIAMEEGNVVEVVNYSTKLPKRVKMWYKYFCIPFIFTIILPRHFKYCIIFCNFFWFPVVSCSFGTFLWLSVICRSQSSKT